MTNDNRRTKSKSVTYSNMSIKSIRPETYQTVSNNSKDVYSEHILTFEHATLGVSYFPFNINNLFHS